MNTTNTNNTTTWWDGDWNVAFRSAVATFDGTNPDSELVVTYSASAPNGSAKYYLQRVMLSDCVTNVVDGAVSPVISGPLPDADYDNSTGVLTTRIDIDTDSITSSADFWTPAAAASDDNAAAAATTGGTIDMCLRMDLYNENDDSLAMEATRITLHMDTTQGFALAGATYLNEDVIVEEQDVHLDYPLLIDFCNDANEIVSPAPNLSPGDQLQVCIRTNATDAIVSGVRSVAFTNDLVDLGIGQTLRVEVVNAAGDATNGQTLVNCTPEVGVCNIKTVTFSLLYQYDTTGNGILDDVSAGATFAGNVVLDFARRRHLEQGQEHNKKQQHRYRYPARLPEKVARFGLDLRQNLVPPPRRGYFSSVKNASSSIGDGVAAAAIALLAVILLVCGRRRRRQQAQNCQQETSTKGAESWWCGGYEAVVDCNGRSCTACTSRTPESDDAGTAVPGVEAKTEEGRDGERGGDDVIESSAAVVC